MRFDPAKGRYAKGPAVPAGESWRLACERPIDDPALNWSSGVVGLPVPPGVLIIDYDGDKGASLQDIEQALGGPLDWSRAAIQHTPSGGVHYAFRCEWDARQGDSLFNVPGFDTRVAGKGFICSGQGYPPINFGVHALVVPGALPTLPAAARARLEMREAPAPKPSQVAGGDALDALRHINPGCSRTQWRNVCYALKGLYGDDGQAIAEQWSSGAFWPGGTPHNYVADGPGSIADQWPSFKAEGGVQPATLFYYAIQEGWRPPSAFDASAVFGAGAGADVFEELVERIRTKGGDVAQVPAIVEAIKAAGCTPLQTALLAAELKGALQDSGVKDKAVGQSIDQVLTTRSHDTPAMRGEYGKLDADNAAVFMQRHYPDGTLIRCEGELFAWGGKAWRCVSPEEIKHLVACDMCRVRMQVSKINSTIDLVNKLAPIHDGVINKNRGLHVAFENGVLDIQTGAMRQHKREDYSTLLLPYDYHPQAQCQQWLAFLHGALDGDALRVATLQEWFGYQLVSDYRHHKVMLLVGPKRCGKGTIGRVLQHLVGQDSFAGGSISSFARDSFLALLRTKTTLFIGDAAKNVTRGLTSLVVERIKNISGNDEVEFDRKYLTALSTTLPTRITIAANNIPNLFDDSGALASRIMPIPFYNSHIGNEDLGLLDKLLSELPGIATWAVEGLRRLLAVGKFSESEVSQQEAVLIRETYNPLEQFIRQYCVFDPHHVTPSRELYTAYFEWCSLEQDTPVSPKTFTSAFKDATLGKARYGLYRINGGSPLNGFRGLRVVPVTGGVQ
jgi:P4 family phage/plasmid primase-like protien